MFVSDMLLMQRYMAVSSAKRLTLDLTCSGWLFQSPDILCSGQMTLLYESFNRSSNSSTNLQISKYKYKVNMYRCIDVNIINDDMQ